MKFEKIEPACEYLLPCGLCGITKEKCDLSSLTMTMELPKSMDISQLISKLEDSKRLIKGENNE